nr:MAG TPA: hypothetical protein [Caudoviricetes sp.]
MDFCEDLWYNICKKVLSFSSNCAKLSYSSIIEEFSPKVFSENFE